MKTYSFTNSQALFARAAKVIPCGIYGHFSPATLVPPTSYPFFAVSGSGAHFTDADGNDFIDYMCAYGPMVLGYNHPVVDEAARKQAELGDTLMGASPVMVDLAEYMVELIPAADWVYFAKNGADAVTYATMIARAATGRDKIVAIEGGYHGVGGWMQGYGHHGVVAADVANTIRIPWNDAAAFERVLEEHPNEIAGFISTPHHHPTFVDSELPAPGYWQAIRSLCDCHGAVLILDDVRCGFRLDVRGSNEYYGFRPDLITFCKAIANGYPISALVGREELKTEAGNVFYTGSYWYQAVPMAAALACIQELVRIDGPRLMAGFGQKLTDGLKAAAARHGRELLVSGPPQIPFLRLAGDESGMLHQRWCAECTMRGAYFTSHHNWLVSCAHSEEDLARTLEIAEEAFAVLEAAGDHPEAMGERGS
jgi:glutamate-1-semialdehyde 2,1-aminomutase